MNKISSFYFYFFFLFILLSRVVYTSQITQQNLEELFKCYKKCRNQNDCCRNCCHLDCACQCKNINLCTDCLKNCDQNHIKKNNISSSINDTNTTIKKKSISSGSNATNNLFEKNLAIISHPNCFYVSKYKLFLDIAKLNSCRKKFKNKNLNECFLKAKC
jgi:hypothetical protein